ncbi:MAG TPA: hypothetical protein VJK03_03785 [Candidatus Nanoarchaeia archaeon]|nr:hypothetical protein [Candidatus Nanoarchaeia archaeon]
MYKVCCSPGEDLLQKSKLPQMTRDQYMERARGCLSEEACRSLEQQLSSLPSDSIVDQEQAYKATIKAFGE